MVPREKLTQLSQVQVLDRLFGRDSDTLTHWQDVPPRALNFLHGLLVLNPDKRLTATQALNHSWFKKPLSEAALLEERYEKVIRFWRRHNNDEVIEYLPGRIRAGQEDRIITSAPKSRKKIPDITFSPYFGLDRHLQPRAASKRKQILDTLNESGSPFLVTEQSQHKTRVSNTSTHMREVVSIEAVKGIDLFGSFRSSKATSQEQSDLDEICLVPTTPLVSHSERFVGFDMSDPQKVLSSTVGATEVDSREGDVGGGKQKRSRRESEDPEERRLRDGVAKDFPRFGTAKALKDAVEKKKQEVKRMNMAGLVMRSSEPTA